MGLLGDREFNLEGWGSDKRLIEGPCGHCHHAVAFKEPENRACMAFTQRLHHGEETEERTHYFVMGLCPRPRCQEATIVYRVEKIWLGSYQEEPELLQERVIFPSDSLRTDLPEEIPSALRSLYREAASIENLSPNGSAFLARRILEQALREHLIKPRGKLVNLIDEFIDQQAASETLLQLMHDVREFGNIAGHPAQDRQGEWTTIEAAEASYTLDVVAELLDHIYVKRKRREAMRERWEAKKRGDAVPTNPSTQVVLGGRDLPSNPPAGLSDDEVPF
jgi:Domain of unknown function (DUF4145)